MTKNLEQTRQILYTNHALARLLYALQYERDAERARSMLLEAQSLADTNAAQIVQLHDRILGDEYEAQRAAARLARN